VLRIATRLCGDSELSKIIDNRIPSTLPILLIDGDSKPVGHGIYLAEVSLDQHSQRPFFE
jgi:hypothetical protein